MPAASCGEISVKAAGMAAEWSRGDLEQLRKSDVRLLRAPADH